VLKTIQFGLFWQPRAGSKLDKPALPSWLG